MKKGVATIKKRSIMYPKGVQYMSEEGKEKSFLLVKDVSFSDNHKRAKKPTTTWSVLFLYLLILLTPFVESDRNCV
jgi:hypothetical protein